MEETDFEGLHYNAFLENTIFNEEIKAPSESNEESNPIEVLSFNINDMYINKHVFG